jgi:hypothetical protein|nr:MAG TPA: protein of unknown function (DUF4969) [Caudoviricetes sp.]
MKRTILVLSILSTLAACGGGSAPAGQPVNPLAVEFSGEIIEQKQTDVAKIESTERLDIDGLVSAYMTMARFVSEPADRAMTDGEARALAGLEMWYLASNTVVFRTGPDGKSTHESPAAIRAQMAAMKRSFGPRDYAGRIMAEVKRGMITRPDSWREAVQDYYKNFDRMDAEEKNS